MPLTNLPMRCARYAAIASFALLSACAVAPDQFLQPGSSQLLTKAESERAIVENKLSPQIKPQLDKPITAVRITMPKKPASWDKSSPIAEKKLTVRFRVTVMGDVDNIEPVGEADPELLARCKEAVAEWKFEPLARNSVPFAMYLTYTFVFQRDR